MEKHFTPETFASYFFGNFGCIMVRFKTDESREFWKEDHPTAFWNAVILGSFYVFATITKMLTVDKAQLSRTVFTCL
jgi:hypothetical protein